MRLEQLKENQDKFLYTKYDDGEPLDGTVYDWLSKTPLKSESWLDVKKDVESEVILATYPHKIFLLKYVLAFIIFLILSLFFINTLLLVTAGLFIFSTLYLLIGLHRYWTNMLVITDKSVIEKRGSIITDTGNKVPNYKVGKTYVKQSNIAVFLSTLPFIRNYANLGIFTSDSGSGGDTRDMEHAEIAATLVPEHSTAKQLIDNLKEDNRVRVQE